MVVKKIIKYRNGNECFPYMTVRRILAKAGAKRTRVRKEAVEELIKVLEEVALDIVKEADILIHSSPNFKAGRSKLTPSSNERNIIKAEDIAIATRRVLSQDLQ